MTPADLIPWRANDLSLYAKLDCFTNCHCFFSFDAKNKQRRKPRQPRKPQATRTKTRQSDSATTRFEAPNTRGSKQRHRIRPATKRHSGNNPPISGPIFGKYQAAAKSRPCPLQGPFGQQGRFRFLSGRPRPANKRKTRNAADTKAEPAQVEPEPRETKAKASPGPDDEAGCGAYRPQSITDFAHFFSFYPKVGIIEVYQGTHGVDKTIPKPVVKAFRDPHEGRCTVDLSVK